MPLPTEPATLTPNPSDTPTLTLSPSDTPTQEPTLTETLTPTPDASPTETPTDFPTLTPMPAEPPTLPVLDMPTVEILSTATPAQPSDMPLNAFVPPMGEFYAEGFTAISVSSTSDLISQLATANSGTCSPNVTLITLSAAEYVLTAIHNTGSFGANGLPIIRCRVHIIGSSAIIRRDTTGPAFRLLEVAQGGELTLEGVTLRGGLAPVIGGGAVLSVHGTVTIRSSRIENNHVASGLGNQVLGGGLYNFYGSTSISDTVFSYNTNLNPAGDGGGIGIIAGSFNATGVWLQNNQTGRDGGGAALLFNSAASLTQSCITGNRRSVPGDNGLFANWGANVPDNWWGAANGPSGLGGGSGDAVLGSGLSIGIPATAPFPICGGTLSTPTPSPSATPEPFKINKVNTTSAAWSVQEELAIDTAMQQVGNAFDALSVIANTPTEAFNRVMLEASGTEILFIRINQPSGTSASFPYMYQHGVNAGQSVTLTYDAVIVPNNGNCLAVQEAMAGSIRRPAAVICNGVLIDQYSGTTFTGQASEFTIVHELGHLFDYRTEMGLSAPIGEANFVVRDCSGNVVIGIFAGSWARGRRGWGTGPAQYLNASGNPVPLITNFQQNSTNIPLEAAADSFLNWVYRLNESGGSPAPDSCASNPLPSPDSWTGQGFLNREWPSAPHPSFIANSVGIPGTLDPSLPGDVRYRDIDQRIRQLFAVYGW